MALEAVVSEITEKGKKEVSAINSVAQAEVEQILKNAQDKAAEIKTSAEDETTRQTTYILNQEVAAANLVVKREILNVQKDLLDDVYAKTVAAIADLPEEFHKKAVRELCKSAAKEIKNGVIYCNERDVPAVEDALSSLKTLSGFSLAGTKEISGGIIAESKDGGLQLDLSYPTYLAEVWETGLKDASEVLFG